jgi:SSS family solute:Na+ symporter
LIAGLAGDPIVIGIVAIYLLGMLGIGWYSSTRISKSDDFMVAGRRLGPFLMAGTLAATEIGGGSTMGVAEKAYGAWGMSAGWYILAMTITFVVLAIIAPRLRASMVRTVPEFFERRYGPPSGVISALLFIVPLIGLTATQVIASSVILNVMTGLSYEVSVVIVCAVVTVYSVLGGLWSVTLTDIVQFVVIVVGLTLAVPFALAEAGGWDAVVSSVPDEKLSLTEGTGVGQIVALVIMYVCSFAVGQETVQRYFAARDEKAAVQGSLIAGGVYVLFAFVPAVLGVIAYSMVAAGSMDGAVLEAEGTRYVLPVVAVHVLPSWLVGLVFAALISATMSSADSDLLAAGSIFSNDIWSKFRKDPSDREILLVTRWTMVAVAALAMGVALVSAASIIGLLVFSFSLRAGGAFVPYVAGHYWRRATLPGALAALAVGSGSIIVFEHWVQPPGGIGALPMALGASAFAFAVFSRFGLPLSGAK